MFRHLGLTAFLFVISLSISPRAKAQCCLGATEWARFHNRDVENWSVQSGLPAKAIRTMLASIGGDDPDENQYLIQRLDVHSLSSRGQILVALTDFGTAHWLSVWVVQAKRPYSALWHTASIPENGTCPEVDLGTQSVLGEATASATTNGQILIKLPENRGGNDDHAVQKTQLLVATFIWIDKTYRLQREQVFSRYEWQDNDYVTRGRGAPPKCQ